MPSVRAIASYPPMEPMYYTEELCKPWGVMRHVDGIQPRIIQRFLVRGEAEEAASFLNRAVPGVQFQVVLIDK